MKYDDPPTPPPCSYCKGKGWELDSQKWPVVCRCKLNLKPTRKTPALLQRKG